MEYFIKYFIEYFIKYFYRIYLNNYYYIINKYIMTEKIFISYAIGTLLFFNGLKKSNKPFDVYIRTSSSHINYFGGFALTFFVLTFL